MYSTVTLTYYTLSSLSVLNLWTTTLVSYLHYIQLLTFSCIAPLFTGAHSCTSLLLVKLNFSSSIYTLFVNMLGKVFKFS